MATLTAADFQRMHNLLIHDSEAWAELKASGLSKWKVIEVLQAIEDRWTADQAGYKADAVAAAGQSLTNLFCKKLAKAWMENKWGGE